jgi:diaminopimelate decarboxylase
VEPLVRCKGRLHCEGISLVEIAERVGTPAYVYSRAAFIERYRELDEAFRAVPHLICYSAKANGNLAVLQALVEAGAGVDIVSGGELYGALRVGADPRKIVFAGVGKSAAEIEQALEAGILFFTVESGPELERIGAIAKRRRTVARFALRINPDVAANTHDYITTGTYRNKFGVDAARALDLYERARSMDQLEAVGVQMHIGSQIMTPEPYIEAIGRVRPLVEELKRRGHELTYFDIGGGYGINYDDEAPQPVEQFAAAILPAVEPLGMTLVMEPGRFIAGNSGVLLTRVEYVKRAPGKTFVIVDAAMNDLIRPALYDAFHRIEPVENHERQAEVVDIVGPVCESGDFFALGAKLPTVQEGELLVVMSAGAYGATMGSTYNARRLPPEVLVDGDRFTVVRRRQTYKGLYEDHVLPDSKGARP